MTLEEDITQIKKELKDLNEKLPKNKHRPVLYIMTFMTMICAYTTLDYNIKKHEKEPQQTILTPKMITKNIIGNSLPEKFYEINNKRIYLEIDGKSVDFIVENIK